MVPQTLTVAFERPIMEVSHLTEKDIPAFVAVDTAAMATWPLSQARIKTHPSGLPREEIIKGWIESSLADPNDETVWLKVMDQEGEIIAGAAWVFDVEGDEDGDVGEGGQEKGVEENVSQAMDRIWKSFKSKTISSRPYASASFHTSSSSISGH